MPTERFILQLETRGGKRAGDAVKRVRTEASAANRTLALLRSSLVVVASARVISGFLETADALTNIRNRIRLVTTSTEQLNAVQARLFSISQETRSSFEDNAVLFNRLARSAGGLGITFNRLLNITRGITQALAISGATTQEARNALIQFSQGLASGALRGDELRSVAEQLPALADAIAEEFQITGQSTADSLGITTEALEEAQKEVGNLTGGALVAFAKANEGILTTERIVRALERSLPKLDAQFSKVAITAGQAFTKFNNQFVLFVGSLSESIDLGKQLDTVLTLIAQNFGKIAIALAAFAGIAVFNLLASQLARLGTTAGGVFGFLFSGFQDIGKFAIRAATVIRTKLLVAFAALNIGLLPLISILATVGLAIGTLVVVANRFGIEFKEVLSFLDSVGGALVGGLRAAILSFREFPAAIADLAVQAVNGLIRIFNKGALGVALILKRVFNIKIDPTGIQIDELENAFEGSAAKVGDTYTENIKKGIDRGLSGSAQDAAKAIQPLLDKLKNLIPQDLQRALKNFLLNKIVGEQAKQASKALKGATDAFKNLRREFDPFAAGMKKINEALVNFSVILRDGNKKQIEDATEALRLLGAQLVDVEDKEFILGQRLLLIDKAQEKLGISAERAAVARQKLTNASLQDTASALRGVLPLIDAQAKLSDIETKLAELRINNKLTSEEAATAQKRLSREALGFGKTSEQVNEEIEALIKNTDGLNVSTAELERRIRAIRLAGLADRTDAGAGIQRSFIKLTEEALDAAKFTEMVFTDAFNTIGDQVAKFVTEGTFSLNDFFRNFAAQLVKLGTQQAIAGIGGLATSQFGLQGPSTSSSGAAGIGGFVAKGLGTLASSFFGGGGGGFTGGGFQIDPKLLSFANGGSFDVSSRSAVGNMNGIDNRLIAFRARDGENVSVSKKGEDQSRGRSVVNNFNFPPGSDKESFNRSIPNIQARTQRSMGIAGRRNG